jgi:hypothetical protein
MAQLISSKLLLDKHQEKLSFMDVFGKAQDVYLSVVSGPSRADKITSTIAAMTTAENAVKAWAAANNVDLAAALAAGAEAISAAIATAGADAAPTTSS